MSIPDEIDVVLQHLFAQSHAQFGNAIKGYWFDESGRCPACSGAIEKFKMKGKDMLSLNAYIFRRKGILIGYFLCGRCAKRVFKDAKENPYRQTAVHERIEANLEKAYLTHMSSMDA